MAADLFVPHAYLYYYLVQLSFKQGRLPPPTTKTNIPKYAWLGTFGLHMLGFVTAYIFQTEVFFDFLGATNSLGIAAYGIYAGGFTDPSSDPRKFIIVLLPVLNRLWLLSFLTYRAYMRGGDGRFDEIKKSFVQFFVIWFFSAVWVWTWSLPMLFILCLKPQVGMTVLDWIVVGFYAFGLIIEVASDYQKNYWIYYEKRRGGICEKGFWNFSRHPNYFGELLMQWCGWFLCLTIIGNAAYSSVLGEGIGAVAGPAFTTFVLLLGTGMPTAEGKNLKRFYENDALRDRYIKYREETSILWPMPKALWKAMPGFLKSTIFCEWKRFEYDPSNLSERGDDAAPTTAAGESSSLNRRGSGAGVE